MASRLSQFFPSCRYDNHRFFLTLRFSLQKTTLIELLHVHLFAYHYSLFLFSVNPPAGKKFAFCVYSELYPEIDLRSGPPVKSPMPQKGPYLYRPWIFDAELAPWAGQLLDRAAWLIRDHGLSIDRNCPEYDRFSFHQVLSRHL